MIAHTRISTKPPRIPKLGQHATGQAVVRIDGKDHYCGKFNSPEAWELYTRLISEWMHRKKFAPSQSKEIPPSDDFNTLTVNELILSYFSFSEKYYANSPGELDKIRLALKPLRAIYGKKLVSEFGPKALKHVRETMTYERTRTRIQTDSLGNKTKIQKPTTLSQRTINQRINIITRMFAWATEEELIPRDIYLAAALKQVKPIRDGRFGVKPPTRVSAADMNTYQELLLHLPGPVKAMLQLINLTAMRSGDVCLMRPMDIDQSEPVWKYFPSKFKRSALSGTKQRVIMIGPEGQKILAPFLENRSPESYLFSPKETMEEIFLERRKNRKTKVQPSQISQKKPAPKRTPGLKYNSQSFYAAIQRVVKKFGLGKLFPNQLRHGAGARIRKEFGIEHASKVMGHSHISTTEIYADYDMTKTMEIMHKIG
jgi:integrase